MGITVGWGTGRGGMGGTLAHIPQPHIPSNYHSNHGRTANRNH